MNSRFLAIPSLLTLWTLLISCEGIVRGSGKVISAADKSPLDSVMITWRGEKEYTDKEGKFEIGQFVGCPTGCPDLEIVLTKKGYETKYINLTKDGPIKIEDATIELVPTATYQGDIWNNKFGNFLYYASMVTAGLGLTTLVMLFIIKVGSRLFWFFVIFLGTIGIHYNFVADFFNVEFLRPVTQFNPPHFRDPSWYKISLPIGVIMFWIYYFKRLRSKTVN